MEIVCSRSIAPERIMLSLTIRNQLSLYVYVHGIVERRLLGCSLIINFQTLVLAMQLLTCGLINTFKL